MVSGRNDPGGPSGVLNRTARAFVSQVGRPAYAPAGTDTRTSTGWHGGKQDRPVGTVRQPGNGQAGRPGDLQLRLLGPVELVAGGRPVDCGPARQRTVLAALGVDAGRLVPQDLLIARVWGDAPPPGVRSGLYSYVTRLRRVLHAAGAPGAAAGLVSCPGGYLLELDPAAVDLVLFRRLTRAARQAPPGPAALGLLDGALALWRGPALGWPDEQLGEHHPRPAGTAAGGRGARLGAGAPGRRPAGDGDRRAARPAARHRLVATAGRPADRGPVRGRARGRGAGLLRRGTRAPRGRAGHSSPDRAAPAAPGHPARRPGAGGPGPRAWRGPRRGRRPGRRRPGSGWTALRAPRGGPGPPRARSRRGPAPPAAARRPAAAARFRCRWASC